MTVAAGSTCQECGAPLDVPYACPGCGALFRDPPGFDHFARFGLERVYDVDQVALERRWLELSRRLHSDRQVGKSSADRTRALMLSASLNEGFAILREPVRRAEYLLGLKGGVGPEKDRRTPQGFLEESLELRETVAEAKAANDRPRLESVLAGLEPRRDAALGRIRELFASGGAVEALRLELNALKYVTNLIDELRSSLRT